jgi:D-glycero-D-manno-heptose 1,7-bisphosphate phosphatase
MTPAFILDRDGVLNPTVQERGQERAPASLAEFRLFPNVRESLRRLAERLPIVIITNQKDVALGHIDRAEVERIHQHLRETLPILDILTCYHADDAGCPCHKPRPGLFFEAADRHDLDLKRSIAVGDHWIDTKAAQAAGCETTILIGDAACERDPAPPTRCFDDLATAAAWILRGSISEPSRATLP